jgi:cell division initiation protein
MRQDRIVSETFGGENVLTPSDLYNHEFKKTTVGGYKPDEVDEFMERVADVLESLIEQVRALKQDNAQQDERLEEYRQMEQTLRSALVSSQEFSQNVLESARHEANAIMEEARAKRAAADLQVTRIAEELTQEIRQLKEQRDRLKQDLLSVLAVHRQLIEDMGSRADDLLLAIAGPVSALDEDTQFPETELEDETPSVELETAPDPGETEREGSEIVFGGFPSADEFASGGRETGGAAGGDIPEEEEAPERTGEAG